MPWVGTITVVGAVILVILIWFFLKTRTSDHLIEMMNKRRATSKAVCRADYVEGLQHITVALALTEDTFYYENADLQASFELVRIDEVEYDDELATGKTLDHGRRVLRLRSHGAAFEFILEPAEAQKWMDFLPPRRADGGRPAARAV